MNLQNFFLLFLIVYISIIQISAVERSRAETAALLRRLFDQYKQTQRKNLKRSSSVIDNLVFTTSRTTTYSPYQSGSCSSYPCQHGGICTPRDYSSYECRCVGPWRGVTCSIADACYKSPCKNGGTCLNVLDDYWCKCTSDYYGNNCQSRFSNPDYSTDQCRPNPCKAGKCVSLTTTYYCQCPDDRYGINCEKYFYKRNVSKRQSFYQLLRQFNQAKNEDKENDERAFYDYKNGIYF